MVLPCDNGFTCVAGVVDVTLSVLIARYAAFAILATIANLAVQRMVLAMSAEGGGFVLAVGAGTLVGLVVKYLLDKRWIFMNFDTSLKADGRRFALYTATGIVTTVLFWGSETILWFFWQTDMMRELGAVLGLTIGYVVKYRLDRRFVFAG